MTNANFANPLCLSDEQITALSPVWTEVEGVAVLRVADSDYIGVPCNGRKNSARFDILKKGGPCGWQTHCQVIKKEVGAWLFKQAKAEWQDSL